MELISSLTPGRFFCDLESKIRPAFVKNNAGLIFGCSLKETILMPYTIKNSCHLEFLPVRLFFSNIAIIRFTVSIRLISSGVMPSFKTLSIKSVS